MRIAGRHKTGRALMVAVCIVLLIALAWLIWSRRAAPPKASPPMHTRSGLEREGCLHGRELFVIGAPGLNCGGRGTFSETALESGNGTALGAADAAPVRE